MYALDLKTFAWTTVLMSGNAPEALQCHKAVVFADSMYIVAGKVKQCPSLPPDPNRSSCLNPKVYQYRFDINKWFAVPNSGFSPTPRQLHAAVSLEGEHGVWSIYMFGGSDVSKMRFYVDFSSCGACAPPASASSSNVTCATN